MIYLKGTDAQISTFKACPRKYYHNMRYIQDGKPKYELRDLGYIKDAIHADYFHERMSILWRDSI